MRVQGMTQTPALWVVPPVDVLWQVSQEVVTEVQPLQAGHAERTDRHATKAIT